MFHAIGLRAGEEWCVPYWIAVFVPGRARKLDNVARYASPAGLSAICNCFVALSGANWHHMMKCAAARLWSPSNSLRNTSRSQDL